MVRELSVVVVAAVLAACGGKASHDAEEPGTGGSTATGGSSAVGGASAGGSAGVGGGVASGGSTAVGGSGGSGGECIPEGDGWNSDTDPTCEDLSVLAVHEPVVADGGGDGDVSPGEAFELKVALSEVAGLGFGWYPGVKFESDHPGVTIQENDWFYGIFACTSYDVGAAGKVDSSVAPGTVVTLTARAAMLNTECPSAPALKVQLTVK
ncbi:MAG: hypothetical protein IPM35_40640 [Myxococcales bacterium]|nr:hypothetical protein [Myxococcales bacterium]